MHYHSRCRRSFNSRRGEHTQRVLFYYLPVSSLLPEVRNPADGYFREIKTIAAGDEVRLRGSRRRFYFPSGAVSRWKRFVCRVAVLSKFSYQMTITRMRHRESPINILRRPYAQIPLSLWDPVAGCYLFPGLRNRGCAGITPPLEDLNKISW